MKGRTFELPHQRGRVHISERIIAHFLSHRQKNWLSKEAGGQIFSHNPDEKDVVISQVTGPYSCDVRKRNFFNPNINKLNSDRESMFSKGLYPVGLWHTHYEKIPSPSLQDKITTHKYLKSCDKCMHSFLQIIVGNNYEDFNVKIWLASKSKKASWIKLKEISYR